MLRRVPLDDMTAIYDRRSGQTHVVAGAVPAILDAMGDAAVDAVTIAAALGVEEDVALVCERLDELLAIGLVERA